MQQVLLFVIRLHFDPILCLLLCESKSLETLWDKWFVHGEEISFNCSVRTKQILIKSLNPVLHHSKFSLSQASNMDNTHGTMLPIWPKSDSDSKWCKTLKNWPVLLASLKRRAFILWTEVLWSFWSISFFLREVSLWYSLASESSLGHFYFMAVLEDYRANMDWQWCDGMDWIDCDTHSHH